MAATAVRPQASKSDGDVALAMMEAAEATGMRVQEPTVIIGELPYKHIFRSEPGRILADRSYDFFFDAYLPKWDDPDDLPEARRYAVVAKANWKRRNSEEMQAAIRAAEAELGDTCIRFKSERTPAGRVCSYYTNSDAVAAVIRHGIERGALTFFKEESKGNNRYYQVGERAYANNSIGRELAMAESEKTGEMVIPRTKGA